MYLYHHQSLLKALQSESTQPDALVESKSGGLHSHCEYEQCSMSMFHAPLKEHEIMRERNTCVGSELQFAAF